MYYFLLVIAQVLFGLLALIFGWMAWHQDTKVSRGLCVGVAAFLACVAIYFSSLAMGERKMELALKEQELVLKDKSLNWDRQRLNESHGGHPQFDGPFCDACAKSILLLLTTGEQIDREKKELAEEKAQLGMPVE